MTCEVSPHTKLAQALLEAVRAQPWHLARDRRRGGQPFTHAPSLDLAVALFAPERPPLWANVLFSREHPTGVVAAIGADAGPVRNVAYLVDPVDARGTSIAWQPGSDWQAINFLRLTGQGPVRFVAPYPASLIKLMVAVGVAQLVDAGRANWEEVWPHGGQSFSLAQWSEPMITVSSNEATDALVALLHARGLIQRGAHAELSNQLHDLFNAQGLTTLRLANTKPSGGWRNGDGAGVGHLQMTAWDSLRLLWRLQDAAAPWLPAGAPPMLSSASRAQLMGWLAAQKLNEVLSSSSITHLPGWQPGIGGRFAHKTGTTESYAADAGRVELAAGGYFLIALLSTLGSCSAPHDDAATDWRVPQLGAAIERVMNAPRPAGAGRPPRGSRKVAEPFFLETAPPWAGS